MSDQENSVTMWVHALRSGNESAATALWERYFDQLVRTARGRMRAMPQTDYDEEDAAISTFQILCSKLREGAYPDLADRDELWNLLLTVLVRKVNRRYAYNNADKRIQSQSLEPSALVNQAGSEWEIVQRESSDQCRVMLARLNDPNLEQVAIWKLEGFTNDEIATKLNRTRRTVQRMLDLIRSIWIDELHDDSTDHPPVSA